uniref:Leucine-rich repeat-containing protein 19-like protein n=1 Tax=Callorhinchus milii TaxID=7868 RepID=V9KP21_CALMI
MAKPWFQLWTGILFMTTATTASSLCVFSGTICDCSGKNLTFIPDNLSANITKLILTNNNISLTHRDVQILRNLTHLKELYLGYNLIQSLSSEVFSKLKNLAILELHNNCLTYLDSNVMPSSNLTHLTIYGNQWNCSCSLLDLQTWINRSKAILGNLTSTTCKTPEKMKYFTIETAPINQSECFSASKSTPAITKSNFITNQSVTMHVVGSQTSAVTTQNTTNNQKDGSDRHRIGKSWKLLLTIMAGSAGSSFLLIIIVKCFKWYKWLSAYDHHKLREEPELIMENPSEIGLNSVPWATTTDETNDQEEETKTTTYKLPEDDDGYIEDVYIDTIEFKDYEE